MDDIVLAHTATKLASAAGRVVICGSHGGTYAGLLAASAGVRGIILNDAGKGRADAGVKGLDVCAAHGLAAVTVHHDSCRIGAADDTAARGTVSAVNPVAATLGIAVGATAAAAAEQLGGAPQPRSRPAAGDEHRSVRQMGDWTLVIVDSNALVRPHEDDGAIIITGSHGGLVGGDPASAGRADAALFAFNDAGIGCDEAGVSRLPALQARGIAAVCVDCFSAEIGSGQSTLDNGLVSRANPAAEALGARAGLAVAALVEAIAARRR